MPEINPSPYGQLIFEQGRRSIKWSKNNPFKKWYWEISTAKCKENETQTPTYTIHQNKFKVGKGLNISHDTRKVLEEKISRKISDILCTNIFTNMSLKTREIKERINKWDVIKLKTLCMAKENSMKMKIEPSIRENIFANDTLDKGFISKIYKRLSRLHSRKQTTQLKNGQKA